MDYIDEQEAINAVVDRIDRLRVKNGLSFYALAQKACLSDNTIKYIYKRRSLPNLNTIFRLCTALEVTVWQFFLMEETTALFTKDELELLEIYERIRPESREALVAITKNLK